MPIANFWPYLDKQVMHQIADTMPTKINGQYTWIWKSLQTGTPRFPIRKAKGAVPHHLGVPHEDPFIQVTSSVGRIRIGWKDLNTKFVPMIYQDFVFSGRKDNTFLQYTWPAVRESLF